MKFLESTDLLKIEDILPFFPDFVVIDDFKVEICNALEDYSTRIEELRAEMDEATASAESIKREIEQLSNRFITVEQGDKCWKCGGAVSSRQFYIFPCQHALHADCLISMVSFARLLRLGHRLILLQAMEFLPSASLRRLVHLQNELFPPKTDASRSLLSSNFGPAGSGSSTPRAGGKSKRDRDLPTSGSTATDLLLGVSGRNKLLAAGDKLRDLIVPDVLAQAVSVASFGVAGSITGGGSGKSKNAKPGRRDRAGDDDVRTADARKELDELVAAVCPLCEGSVVALDKPFISETEDVGDWAV